jgi:putative membrane protein
LVYEFISLYKSKAVPDDLKKRSIIFYGWIAAIFIISIIIEIIGVETGAVFGVYQYGDVLTPFIGSVPMAIGFAWINILLPSLVMAKFLIHSTTKKSSYLIAILTGIFMVFFDFIMEPSAIVLGYWNWAGDSIPIQNYVVWFVLGTIFAFTGVRLKILQIGTPLTLIHAYIAQLLYFGLVAIK